MAGRPKDQVSRSWNSMGRLGTKPGTGDQVQLRRRFCACRKYPTVRGRRLFDLEPRVGSAKNRKVHHSSSLAIDPKECEKTGFRLLRALRGGHRNLALGSLFLWPFASFQHSEAQADGPRHLELY